MTFTLGLASVFMMNDSLQFPNEVTVNVPKIQSESPIVIFPTQERLIPYCNGRVGRKPENSKYCVVTKAKL